jgi:uncharacterized membrane protein YeaQ/YmgE (transglycosylase-associated protein family)
MPGEALRFSAAEGVDPRPTPHEPILANGGEEMTDTEIRWVLFLLIGFVAGVIGREGRLGTSGNVILGILGAALGGNILGWFGLADYGLVTSLVTAAAGSMVLLAAARLIKEK